MSNSIIVVIENDDEDDTYTSIFPTLELAKTASLKRWEENIEDFKSEDSDWDCEAWINDAFNKVVERDLGNGINYLPYEAETIVVYKINLN